VGTHRVQRGRE